MMKKSKPANRSRVLQTAASLFLTKGYHATSMDEIVAESKVAKTNIYYHFKSKEELLSAILEDFIQAYTDLISNVMSQTSLSVRERFERFVRLLLQQRPDCSGGCPFLTLYVQIPHDAPRIREQVRLFFRSQVDAVAALLNEGVQKREFQADLPVGPTAQLIVSAIEGGLFLQQANEDPALLEDVLSTLAYLLK
jgi:AcrR family transcriptional regulator